MPPETPKGKKRATAAVESESSPRSAKKARRTEHVDEEVFEADVVEEVVTRHTPKKRTPKSKLKGTAAPASIDNGEDLAGSPRKTPKRKSKVPAVDESKANGVEAHNDAEEAETPAKVKRKRKTKEEKEAEMLPFAPRTVGSKLLLGAHVSAAGGVQNAVLNSVQIGGNAFALFLKSQRKWENPPLQESQCSAFRSSCTEHAYMGAKAGATPPIVPHGSYLVNLAHPDDGRVAQAYASYLDDLARCHRLGIQLYNIHPGNAGASASRAAALARLAAQLNRAHGDPSTGSVVTLLETMAAAGNTLGGTFEDLAAVIGGVRAQARVGVCLDTCHVFAAGYDVRGRERLAAVLDEFDRVVGLRFLRAIHLNDSKAPLGSARDLHANIGTGFLGLRAFHAIVNEERLWGVPMVLETPIEVKDASGKEVQDKGIWAGEIKLLESLVGMDVESEEFKALESGLWEKGRSERERVQKQVDKKEEKDKKVKDGKGNGRKKVTKSENGITVKDLFAKAKGKLERDNTSAGKGNVKDKRKNGVKDEDVESQNATYTQLAMLSDEEVLRDDHESLEH